MIASRFYILYLQVEITKKLQFAIITEWLSATLKIKYEQTVKDKISLNVQNCSFKPTA